MSTVPYPYDVPVEVQQVEAQLLGPGGFFEVVEEEVAGERLRVVANRARSLREMLVNSVAQGDNEYAAFTGDAEHFRRFTFAEHARLVASTAAVLRDEYGVGPGDRVAILGANSPEWIVTFWASVSLGAIAVGLNGWWTEP